MKWLSLSRSIYFRLTLITAIAGMILLILVGAGIKHLIVPGPQHHHSIVKNIKLYFDYLSDDAMTHPDRESLQQLTKPLSIQIVMLSPERGVIDSAPGLPAPKELYQSLKENKGHRRRGAKHWPYPWGHYNKYIFTMVKKNDHTFFFLIDEGMPWFHLNPWALALLLLSIAGSIAGLYYFVRRELLPLKAINEGVKRLGDGDFSQRLSGKGAEELAVIAGSFNQMAGQIDSTLKQKDQLLMDISHELRSPLTRMKLAIAINSSQGNKDLGISEDIDEMESLITNLLDAARFDNLNSPPTLTSLDLREPLFRILCRYRQRQPGFLFVDPQIPFMIRANPALLERIFVNILDNAYKYAGDSGRSIEVRLYADESKVVIKDYGIGILPENLEKIFDPFFRVDDSRTRQTGGFGLGLHLVHRLMSSQEGEISIKSEVGVYTEVTLIFSSGFQKN